MTGKRFQTHGSAHWQHMHYNVGITFYHFPAHCPPPPPRPQTRVKLGGACQFPPKKKTTTGFQSGRCPNQTRRNTLLLCRKEVENYWRWIQDSSLHRKQFRAWVLATPRNTSKLLDKLDFSLLDPKSAIAQVNLHEI